MSLEEGEGARWSNRALWRLIWPLMVELLLSVLIGMADTVMVTSVGEAAVSGISLVDAINMLLITMLTALATGGAVVISQYLGRRDGEGATRGAMGLLFTNLLVSLVLSAVALLFGGGILRLIYGHIEADVMGNARVYFVLTALSYPFLGIYNAGASVFRSLGNSRVGMAISVAANLVNIGGNALLIYGFGWGVAGAGTASLVSRVVSAVAVVWLLWRVHHGPIVLRRAPLRLPDRRTVKQILRIGLPNGLENSTFQIGKLMVSRIISTFGTAAIAANAIAGSVASLGFVQGQAIGLAMLTVIGQCAGAGDSAAARRYNKKLVLLCHATITVVSLVFLVFGRQLLGMFNLSDEARAIAWDCCAINFIAMPLMWPESFALPNSLRAVGDVRYTMLASLVSMWAFRVGFSFLFAYTLGWGVQGVWLAMVIDWLARAVLFLLRWRTGVWEKIKVLE